MSKRHSRRQMLGHAARGAGALTVCGAAVHLGRKAVAANNWVIEPQQCINFKAGIHQTACDKCATTCVLPLSAVRAVNDHAKCGRCCICPAYFDVTSEPGEDRLPGRKLCPRDAITRKAIGDVDPSDPLNNFYEYVIDEARCNGCGKCVMACKEPAGLGSIRPEIRYDLCKSCNRCSIAQACPAEALRQK